MIDWGQMTISFSKWNWLFKLPADWVSNWCTCQPINCPAHSVIDSVSGEMINYLTKQPTHVDSINKILGEAKISQKFWLPWLTDRNILAFDRPRTDQMALKLFLSFGNSFKYVPGFSCLSKRFLDFFFFLQGFSSKWNYVDLE